MNNFDNNKLFTVFEFPIENYGDSNSQEYL